ncbi:hypothetical protein CBR_g38500 [Chara braunii]|uniref:CCHC-type domain-containing protein n=1 Tax=Chara braunii TaxID=69332 RepID=A0A388JNS9_CHABU|nr:hypothetical protein CBR_g38500 [Chara braunii]|eukprot:GBG59476.1 hypothetical protein CBR_g38500 [Chara braunii]
MGDRRDYDRRRTRSGSEERVNSRGSDRQYDRGGERFYRRSPPRCFSCGERGHYANQCRNNRPATESRPSTSHDVQRGGSTSPRREGTKNASGSSSQDSDLRQQLEELTKSLAGMSEFVQSEKLKKAEEEKAKKEVEEEEQRLAAEKLEQQRKERRRMEKIRKENERLAEIGKKVELQIAIKTSEFFDRVEASLGPALTLARKAKGKKQVVHVFDPEPSSGKDSDSSATKEIRAKTGRLAINEKWKRGPEPEFEDSPPMLTPGKRTPGIPKEKATTGGTRRSRSKAKVKTKLSPYVEKLKKTPGQPSTVAKLRFHNQAMEELRGMDAQELQAICKSEGLAYNDKIDAIFDIASYRTRKAFREVEPVDLFGQMSRNEDDSTSLEDEDQDQDA